jgi:hypothetical protein
MIDLKDLLKNPEYMAHLREHNRKEMRERTRQLLGPDFPVGSPVYKVKVSCTVTPVRTDTGLTLMLGDMVFGDAVLE